MSTYFRKTQLDVQDSKLYFAGNIDPSLGRELYSLAVDVEVVATRNVRSLPVLDVTVTSESFTVNSEKTGVADVTVLGLDGRLISRSTAPVNATEMIGTFSGIRLYVIEFEGRGAVRRMLGRRKNLQPAFLTGGWLYFFGAAAGCKAG